MRKYSSLTDMGTLFKLVSVTLLFGGVIIGALAAPGSLLIILIVVILASMFLYAFGSVLQVLVDIEHNTRRISETDAPAKPSPLKRLG